jgi:hypothetical protein
MLLHDLLVGANVRAEWEWPSGAPCHASTLNCEEHTSHAYDDPLSQEHSQLQNSSASGGETWRSEVGKNGAFPDCFSRARVIFGAQDHTCGRATYPPLSRVREPTQHDALFMPYSEAVEGATVSLSPLHFSSSSSATLATCAATSPPPSPRVEGGTWSRPCTNTTWSGPESYWSGYV